MYVRQYFKIVLVSLQFSVRENESVCDVDMLHAADYATMNLNQLKNKMLERKEKDNYIQTMMMYSLLIQEFVLQT